MQITFTLNKDNYWLCLRHLLKTPAQMKASFMVLARLILVLIVLSYILILLSAFSWITVAIWGFLLILLIPVLMGKQRYISVAKITPGVFGRITVTLTPNYCSRKSEVLETIVPWQSFIDLKRTNDGILLFLSERVAHVIPQDAFGSSEDAQEFYQLAYQCWQAAKSGSPLSELPPSQSQSWPPAPIAQ